MLLKPVSFLKKAAAAAAGFTKIGEQQVSGNGPTYTMTAANFTTTPSSGDIVAIVFAWSSSPNVSSVVVDAGGGNETTATIRQAAGTTSRSVLIADLVWPATGTLNISVTQDAATFQNVAFSIWDMAGKTYADGSVVSDAATGSGGQATITDTFTAGDEVLFALCGQVGSAQTIVSGLDSLIQSSVVPTSQDFYLGVDDSATGSSTNYTITAANFKSYSIALAAYN